MSVVFPESMWAEMPMFLKLRSSLVSSSSSAGCAANPLQAATRTHSQYVLLCVASHSRDSKQARAVPLRARVSKGWAVLPHLGHSQLLPLLPLVLAAYPDSLRASTDVEFAHP